MMSRDVMMLRDVMTSFDDLKGKNTDKEDTMREGRQRSGVFIVFILVNIKILQLFNKNTYLRIHDTFTLRMTANETDMLAVGC